MVQIQHSPKNLGPYHPPRVDSFSAIQPSIARNVKISVKDPRDHYAPAILHEPREFDPNKANGAAVVLISGAGGGVSGPAGIYPSLGDKFTCLLGIPCIRLDYREPAQGVYCTADVIACFNYLEQEFSSSRFVVVGWSFGGSPCFSVAAKEPERLRGVATVASQTAGTSGVKRLNPRPLLLMHGTGDTVLNYSCSQSLYNAYGSGGRRELRFFEGDDHGLSKNAPEAEKLILTFVAKTLGLGEKADIAQYAGQDLAGSRYERIKEMVAGHDLAGERL